MEVGDRDRSGDDFSVIVPAPPEVEEYLIAGVLAAESGGTGEVLVTVDLAVPATAEIVLEGYVELG